LSSHGNALTVQPTASSIKPARIIQWSTRRLLSAQINATAREREHAERRHQQEVEQRQFRGVSRPGVVRVRQDVDATRTTTVTPAIPYSTGS